VKIGGAAKRSALHSLLFLASLVTIAIWPTATDGVSLIKSLILIPGTLSFSLLYGRYLRAGLNSLLGYIVLGFIAWNFLLILLSDNRWYALFGVPGRSTGCIIYICLALILLTISQIATSFDYGAVLRAFGLLATGVTCYGLLQALHADPIHWVLSYSGIIETFGNPNFAGAFSGLSISVFLTKAYQADVVWKKISYTLLAAAAGIDLYASHALQGLVITCMCLAVIAIALAFQRSANLGRASLAVAALGAMAFVSGLFNAGPLGHLVYKASVGYRADFYRTAIAMIKKHPLTGVGMDRFGVNYRLFRDSGQVLRLGVDNYSDSAHNIYLHFAATGGLPFAILLLSINIYVFYRGATHFRQRSHRDLTQVTIFGLWLGMQADLLVSPDSLGISLWGWIFAGLIVSRGKERTLVTTLNRSPLMLTSVSLLFLGIVVCESFQLRASISENTFFNAQVDLHNSHSVQAKELGLKRAESLEPLNSEWPIYSANSLLQDKDYLGAQAAARRAIAIDPKDYRAWWFLATAQEESGDRAKAIEARKKSISLDPWNYADLLQLGEDLKAAGDIAGAKAIIAQIDAFAAHTAESATAHKDFGA
jgi:O-antigen ligase